MRKFLLLALLVATSASAFAISWVRYDAIPGFSAEFPAKPVVSDRSLSYDNGGDRLHLRVLDVEGLTLYQAYRNLEVNMRLYAADYGGEVVSKKNVKFGDLFGYRFKVSGPHRIIDAVWLVDGKVWVQADGVHQNLQSTVTDHFLDSLQFPEASEDVEVVSRSGHIL
jgi:hypothetical protein